MCSRVGQAVWLVSCLKLSDDRFVRASVNLETFGWDLQRRVLEDSDSPKGSLKANPVHNLIIAGNLRPQTLSPRLGPAWLCLLCTATGDGASSATIAALAFELCLLLTVHV